jgi:hypothetical protein
MHLPFASDPALFHPLPGSERRLRWVFCGALMGRRLVPRLARISRERGWAHLVIAPELGNTVDPLELNAIYNQAGLGMNEQHLMTFGREINQRAFDYGMAGIPQISDNGHISTPLLGEGCRAYAQGIGADRDLRHVIRLVEEPVRLDPDRVHAHFARNHSFGARLAALSVASGIDLTRGRATLADFRDVVDRWSPRGGAPGSTRSGQTQERWGRSNQ